ncbi:4Fe-4S dicluster domain-containing protein [Thermospira aquatica]|uniref:4Fe-4S dicluster domain-containing protein n=1 Tax=Thermospira aquatica TaxID=2828656 RepID=A0AAX3BG90_9SPIR|nr:4Fe-4S dicluster domain-containing protein [Thermospira aquatica]URA11377.1 4Fe-4S dicluster domain-containing protein [Thermospira aquatica]
MAGKFRVNILKDRCKGCDLCVVECPVKILVKGTNLNIRGLLYVTVTDSSLCIGCRRCATVCPDVAIVIEQEEEQ